VLLLAAPSNPLAGGIAKCYSNSAASVRALSKDLGEVGDLFVQKRPGVDEDVD
jgi:hypothetical protein